MVKDDSHKTFYLQPNSFGDTSFKDQFNGWDHGYERFLLPESGDIDYSEYTNLTYVSDCHNGVGGYCNITYAPIGFELSDMFLVGLQNPSNYTARLSCVNKGQTNNNDHSLECLTVKSGLDGSVKYGKQDYSSHSHNSPADSSYAYVLTKSGNIFEVGFMFNDASGRNQVTDKASDNAFSSQDIYATCVTEDCNNPPPYGTQDKYLLTFSNGEAITYQADLKKSYKPTNWSHDIYDYNYTLSTQIYPKSNVFNPNNGYEKWLESGNQSDGTMQQTNSTTFGLDLNFYDKNEQSDKLQVILVSDNGQYRLVYTGLVKSDDTDDDGINYTIAIQKLSDDGKSWNNLTNDGNALFFDKVDGKIVSTDIARLTFQSGNLTTYYYDNNPRDEKNNNPYQVINSVKSEYLSHGYQWVDDPYAYLHLNNNGHLDIVSSNDEAVTGNSLGYVLGSGQNILWANYWLGEKEYWDNLNNLKLLAYPFSPL